MFDIDSSSEPDLERRSGSGEQYDLEDTELIVRPFTFSRSGRVGSSDGNERNRNGAGVGVGRTGEKGPRRDRVGSAESESISNIRRNVEKSAAASAGETDNSEMAVNTRTRDGSDDVDSQDPASIRRLFEGREFEGELLQFLVQRMDPPSRVSRTDDVESEDTPPTYRPA